MTDIHRPNLPHGLSGVAIATLAASNLFTVLCIAAHAAGLS